MPASERAEWGRTWGGKNDGVPEGDIRRAPPERLREFPDGAEREAKKDGGDECSHFTGGVHKACAPP